MASHDFSVNASFQSEINDDHLYRDQDYPSNVFSHDASCSIETRYNILREIHIDMQSLISYAMFYREQCLIKNNTRHIMNEFIQNSLQTRLFSWLTRRMTNAAVRWVGELPLVIGSDIGIVRSENQDRVAVLRMQPERGQSLIVTALCDGMGGMLEGSACAAQAIARFFTACIGNRNIPPAQRVVLAAQDANRYVHSLYKGRGGATLSAVLRDSIAGMVGVNVGDSRIYAFQGNKLEQVTIDDTMAGLLKDNHHPIELLQFIGMGDGLDPHVINIPASHESIILTSDGVHFIDKQVMQMVMQATKDSGLAVRRLIEIAKWCGGHDNASVVAIRPFPSQLPLLDDPGTIQIWDPFGELQIIMSETTASTRMDNKPPCNEKPFVPEESRKSKQSTKSAKKEKPAKRKGAVNVVPKKEGAETEKERPQLKIYFTGDTDMDNKGH